MISKVQETKGEKKMSWTFSKIKTCASKDTIKKVIRQLTEWDKIFSNHISDEGLAFSIQNSAIKVQIA